MPELSRVDAANAMGAAVREVREVVHSPDLDGHVVTLHDGSQSLVQEGKFVRLLEADERILSTGEREELKAKAEQVEAQPEPPEPELTTADVPSGNAEKVLEWVGDDPDRAALALEVEQGREPNPRQGLVVKLEHLRDAGKDDEEPQG